MKYIYICNKCRYAYKYNVKWCIQSYWSESERRMIKCTGGGVWRGLMKIVDYIIKCTEFFSNIIDPPETWCKHPEYPWILLSSKGY